MPQIEQEYSQAQNQKNPISAFRQNLNAAKYKLIDPEILSLIAKSDISRYLRTKPYDAGTKAEQVIDEILSQIKYSKKSPPDAVFVMFHILRAADIAENKGLFNKGNNLHHVLRTLVEEAYEGTNVILKCMQEKNEAMEQCIAAYEVTQAAFLKKLKENQESKEENRSQINYGGSNASSSSQGSLPFKEDCRIKNGKPEAPKYRPRVFLGSIVKRLYSLGLPPDDLQPYVEQVINAYGALRPFILESKTGIPTIPADRKDLQVTYKNLATLLDNFAKIDCILEHRQKENTPPEAYIPPKMNTTIPNYLFLFYKEVGGTLFPSDQKKAQRYLDYWEKDPAETGLMDALDDNVTKFTGDEAEEADYLEGFGASDGGELHSALSSEQALSANSPQASRVKEVVVPVLERRKSLNTFQLASASAKQVSPEVSHELTL